MECRRPAQFYSASSRSLAYAPHQWPWRRNNRVAAASCKSPLPGIPQPGHAPGAYLHGGSALGARLQQLILFDPHHYPEIVGDLAKSWTVSDDHLTLYLKLHEGVKFHDGSELTSADVKASWDRIVFPSEGVISQRRSNYQMIKASKLPIVILSCLSAPSLAGVPVEHGPSGQLHLCQKISRFGCPLL